MIIYYYAIYNIRYKGFEKLFLLASLPPINLIRFALNISNVMSVLLFIDSSLSTSCSSINTTHKIRRISRCNALPSL